jgi:hypothetical protein
MKIKDLPISADFKYLNQNCIKICHNNTSCTCMSFSDTGHTEFVLLSA